MKTSTSTATLVALVASALSLVSAGPVLPRDTKVMAPPLSLNLKRSVGAAYFMTNEPEQNRVISASIRSDGTLTLDRAVSTAGSGDHGVSDPIGPDPLFSQGSVKASAKGQVLATVNSGSNTVTLFSIDPKTPTVIKRIGNPISSEGEFPMSLAFNDDGSRLCVLNGGAVNGVNCFSVDKKTGLKPIPNTLRSLNLNQTTPANGPPGSASHLIFTEDGSKLIASVKGGLGNPPQPGFFAVWDVQAEDGSLSADFNAVAPPSGGLLPFSMTQVPGKNALLVTDPGVGFDIVDLDGDASVAVPIDGQSATCWSSFSAKTGTFFLTDIGTSIVTEVRVDDDLKPTIVKQYPQTANIATIDNDVATVGGKDFLYVLTPNATSIQVLSLPSAGNARHLQTVDIGRPAKAAGVQINAFNLQGMTHFLTQ